MEVSEVVLPGAVWVEAKEFSPIGFPKFSAKVVGSAATSAGALARIKKI